MVLRLLHPDVVTRDSVCVISEQYAGDTCAFMPDLTYSEYIPAVIAHRSLALSIATDLYKSAAHNCLHAECRFFPLDLCKRWWKVPEHAEQCEFPRFVESATTRRLNAIDSTLEQVKGD
jgi:hypothetical protein